jgi:hypothetical protein
METMLPNHYDQNQQMICKLNGQFIDNSLTTQNTPNNNNINNNNKSSSTFSAFTSTITKNQM